MIGLTYVREKKSLTMQDLADEIGVSKQLISFWEKGERSIKEKYLDKLIEFFHIEGKYLKQELNEIDMLIVDRDLISNQITEIDSGTDTDKTFIKNLRKEIWEIQKEIDRKKMLKTIETNLKDEESRRIYEVLNVLLLNRFKAQINKDLLYGILNAFQDIFISENEDNEFTRIFSKVFKAYELYLKKINGLALEFRDEVGEEELLNKLINGLIDVKPD